MTVENLDPRTREPVHFLLPREATLFARYNGDGLPFAAEPFVAPVNNFVSTHRRRAGQAFRRARESRGINKKKMEGAFSNSTRIITLFEAGHATVSLPHVLSVAERHFQGEDYDLKELRDHVEEDKWIKTLTRPGISIGRAITLLRLYNLQRKTQFARDADVAEINLSHIELGHIEPKIQTINQLIAASSIDNDGIPAQIIRLIGQKRDPMSLLELQTCTFGELIQYIRQLKGLTTQNVANLFEPRKLSGSISNIESSKKIANKQMRKELISLLKVDPKSILAEILNAKIDEPDKPIAEDLLARVFTGDNDGQFVFSEHIYETAHFPQADREKVLTELDAIKNTYENSENFRYVVNAMLTHLRKLSKLTLAEVAQNRELTPQKINSIEHNKHVPSDVIIMKILGGLGYDIHDPVTLYFIAIIEEQARIRSENRTQIMPH